MPSDAGAPIGMKWFRSNIKHGSRLALLALAIQFALSFGHFHGVAAQAAPTIQSGQTQSIPSNDLVAPDTASQAGQQQPASDRDSDGHQNDVCAICAVMALANAVLFATPPVLLLPQAVEFLYLTTDAEFVHLNSARIAFQPRAPPIS
jgi:Protein of unknown function (DUF2946)